MKKAAIVLFFLVLLLLPPVARIVRNPFFDIRMIVRLAGLIGFTLMSIQFMLSSRIPLLEKSFGQDKLILAHRTAGIASVLILAAHGPLYLIERISLDGGLFFAVPQDLPIINGIVGFVILLLLGISAAFRLALGIPYDRWKTWHRISYVIYPPLFLHAMFLGGTIRSSRIVYIQFIAMFGLVMISWGWRFFLWMRARRHPYMLSAVDKLNYNVHQFSFAGPPLDHHPGQFAYLTLTRDGKALPAHPFTISSSPLQKDLVFTIKASGDYTSEIPALPPGTEAFIEGPFGRFSYLHSGRARDLLFIAGGVGITPMLSMLRIMKTDDPDRNVILLWGNRTVDDLFLNDELGEIQETMKNLRIVHVFSAEAPDSPPFGEQREGFIDADCISEYIVKTEDQECFVCGPPVMMDKLLPQLRRMGIPKKSIHMERFGF